MDEIIAALGVDKTLFNSVMEKNKIFLLTTDQHTTLKNNIQKEGYDKGFGVGYKTSFKDLGAKAGFEIPDGMDFSGLQDFSINKMKGSSLAEIEKLKSDLLKGQTDKEKEYNTSLQTLQAQILERDNSIKSERENRFKDIANSDLNTSLAAINISVPNEINLLGETFVSEYLAKQHEIAKTLFNAKYDFKINPDGSYNIADKEGNILKDKLQNPSKIQDITTSLVTTYLNVTTTQAKGRGVKDNNGKPSIEGLKGLPKDGIAGFISSKGLKIGTNEADAIYSEWSKLNTK